MKLDRTLYDNYNLPHGTRYHNLFSFPSVNRNIVTFQDNKKLPVYSWFPYKQGFSKTLVERILSTAELPSDPVIYDPFLGSGTTALCSIEHGFRGNGSDLLPLCAFVAKTKISALTLDPEEIVPSAKKILNSKIDYQKKWPDVKIINKTIPVETQSTLMNYRVRIEQSEYSSELKDVLLLALASSIESCSFIKKDGGFARIVQDKQIGDIKETFLQYCENFYQDLIQFHRNHTKLSVRNVKTSKITVADARAINIPDESVDLVITSPPYLNKTDYTRVYSLELCFLFIESFDQLKNLRYNSFCSHVEAKPIFPRLLLPDSIRFKKKALSAERLSNPKHPEMVDGYFHDLYYSLRENFRYLKCNGKAVWIVWNSRFSGVHFPVDTLLCELAESVGFGVEKIECIRLTGTSAQQAKVYGEIPLRESIIHLVKKSRTSPPKLRRF